MSSYIHLISIDDPSIYSRCSMMYSLLIKLRLKNLVPLTFMLSALWNKGVFPAISYSCHLLNTCPCVVESVSTLFVLRDRLWVGTMEILSFVEYCIAKIHQFQNVEHKSFCSSSECLRQSRVNPVKATQQNAFFLTSNQLYR